MKAWWLDYHPALNTVEFDDYEEYSALSNQFRNAEAASGNWKPVRVNIIDRGKTSDFLNRLSGALIVSEKAKELLSQVEGLQAEFLPLQSTDQFYIMNVLTALDCVDPEKSKVKRALTTLTGYEELELREDIVAGHPMFRIRLHEGDKVLNEIYVSDEVKELIENNLKGYQLINMWDSDYTWQQRDADYDRMCREVDRSLVETFSFSSAIKHIQKFKGEIAYSNKWALKVDERNKILLGNLLIDGTYSWIDPIYYPPIILGLTWGIKEKKSFIEKIRGSITFRLS